MIAERDINKIAYRAHAHAKGAKLLEHEDLKEAVFHKIQEESEEFLISCPSDTFSKDSEQSEIADIILTLYSYCIESGYDIEKLLSEKMYYNEHREDHK